MMSNIKNHPANDGPRSHNPKLDRRSMTPFSLGYLPFALGSWLILTILTSLDSPSEPVRLMPFTGFSAAIFTVFLVSPFLAFTSALITSGWVQFRSGNDYSRIVRPKIAFLAGCLTPLLVYASTWLILYFPELLADATDWIVLSSTFGIYILAGEFIIVLAQRVEAASLPPHR